MPLRITVGGFFGDEGKGKLSAYLALKDNYAGASKQGGPQAGHTAEYNGKKYVFRQLPSAVLNPNTQLFLSVGTIVNPEVVLKEIAEYKEFDVESRLFIDENATVINPEHIEREKELVKSVGSVGTGTGIAHADRVLRKEDLVLVRHIPELRRYSRGIDTSEKINLLLDERREVGVEGSHGTFLSLHHGYFPWGNAYDNDASSLLGQIGIGPRRADSVYIVFKAFVSRVGKGPLPGQLSAEEAEKRRWVERGSVSGRLRRVAPFNIELAKKSMGYNYPTDIGITKVDILFPEVKGVKDYNNLSTSCQTWLDDLEKQLGGKVPITLIGTGPGVYDIVDRREERGTI